MCPKNKVRWSIWDYVRAVRNKESSTKCLFNWTFYINDEIQQHTFPGLEGFPRSEIFSMVEGESTAIYRDLYLTGSQGEDGFPELLDELNCYVHDLGFMALTGDYIETGTSGKDGAIAFLYFLELYLKRARINYPNYYAQLQAEESIVDLVGSLWRRTHHLLAVSDEYTVIEISYRQIAALAHKAENMDEISQFVGHAVDTVGCWE